MTVQSDIVITAGIDDAEFVRGLERMGGYSKRKAWQIAKDFERFERAKERAARQNSAKIRQSYQRMQAANQVMTVAIAAGAGVVYKALTKAAEGNRELRNEIESTRRAADGFMAELGDDLTPFVGGLDDVIDRLGRARREASDFVAMFALGRGGRGQLYEINYQLEQAAKGRAAFEDTQRAQELERELFGEQDDPDGSYRRESMRKIAQLRDPQRKAEMRERLRKQIERRAAERQRETANNSYQRSLDNAARRAATDARRNPEDYDARRNAINARFAAQRNRARASIENDSTIPDADKARAVQDALTLISAEQAEQLELAREHNEELQRRRRLTEQEQAMSEARQRIELARAKGRDDEADAMERALEYERRRLAIVNDESLGAERRERMLANEEAIYNASLGRLERGRPLTPGAGVSVAAGFAGDSTTRGQVIGIKSEARRVVNLQEKANGILTQIRDAVAEGTVATVG